MCVAVPNENIENGPAKQCKACGVVTHDLSVEALDDLYSRRKIA